MKAVSKESYLMLSVQHADTAVTKLYTVTMGKIMRESLNEMMIDYGLTTFIDNLRVLNILAKPV